MSNVIYIAADMPLTPHPNPHEKMLSINEALAIGKNVSEILLQSDIDRDKPNVILVADREININIDTGIVTDGDYDDDFSVWCAEKTAEMCTDKKYCAVVDCHRYTIGRVKQFIEYLKEQLANLDEIEIWHMWLGGDEQHNIIKTTIPITEFTVEHFLELEKRDVWNYTAYCYTVTK